VIGAEPPPQIQDAQPPPDPRAEYSRRLHAACAEQERLRRREGALPKILVAVVLAGVVPLVFAFAYLHVAWLALPVVAFVVLVIWLQDLRSAVYRSGEVIDYYRRGLARLDGRWPGGGGRDPYPAPPGHPYATDLDLFGEGSLFDRLNTSRTQAGAATLAAWLLTAASPEEIRARQEAIDDLRGRLDLRERLSLQAARLPARIDLDGLIRWGAEPPHLPSRARGLAVYGLMLLAALLLVGWQGGPVPFVAVRVLAVGQLLFWLIYARRVARVVAPLRRRSQDLRLWVGLLQCLEDEPFQAPALVRLRDGLRVHGKPPSRCVAQLTRLTARLAVMSDPMWRWTGWPIMLTTRTAFALEAWRRANGPHVAAWVEAVASFEALASLAAYAYENPTDPFAELADAGPCFEAEGLGHPLLPRGQCVTNDLRLGGDLQALLVTGSNMSGKSTLLRTVGVNAVLALAGAPVRARRLRLSPLSVGASLRVQDSLQAGESRFLAEIHRLRQMVELAQGPVPLLFLIDEILQGTNPNDRRQGAEAVLVGLLRLGAIGLVTTHDLPLTALAERPGTRMANVHFADQIQDGRPTFDYRMKKGVVPQSNALALMRLVGLPTSLAVGGAPTVL
jgi:hypothetical protein